MQHNSPIKVLLWAIAVTTAVVTVACLVLPRGVAQTAISDICGAALVLGSVIAFTLNGLASKGRLRWFWMLQAAGWALWLADQFVWLFYDLILAHKMPGMFPADALLFLAGAPMIGGLLLRPHREPSEPRARLGILDFLLLLMWWCYLYVSFVMSWQYLRRTNLSIAGISTFSPLLRRLFSALSSSPSGVRVREPGRSFTRYFSARPCLIPSHFL